MAHRENKNVCYNFARVGDLIALENARIDGCPWNINVSVIAAKKGFLDVLMWARANGCDYKNERVCSAAAFGGHLNVLKWAHENGCPWDEWTCTYAAYIGDLEMLKWVREHGCPWDESVCSYAAVANHVDVLEWAWRNGCKINKKDCLYLARENKGVVDWVKSRGKFSLRRMLARLI